ncbi:MAG TPA: DUF1611 domain-containing protein [Puia sp.]|nr:DUF1611 domain-containing protein [Puia sp.]
MQNTNAEGNCRPEAILLTNGLLRTSDAKTAHGLIRGTERFNITGVIDHINAGKDAGELLDGKHRNIPVFAKVEEAVAAFPHIHFCIIGVALSGGRLPAPFIPIIRSCIVHGLSVVNGLHQYLNDNTELIALARTHQVELIDIRRPRPVELLHFWTGEIYDLKTPVIAVLGMDCATGKRTTARLIRDACQEAGINAQMIYTGQTGWMQGGRHGFIVDSTLNDFISGEIEHAILQCASDTSADLILLEGQSSLRNPSGPCGSEFLLSGNARYVVLLFAPKQKYYKDHPNWGMIPSVSSEIELIAQYGSKVIAIALNTEDCSDEEAKSFQNEFEDRLRLPVLLPLQEGVAKLIPMLALISGVNIKSNEPE